MIELSLIAITLYLLYFLFIKGNIYPILLFIIGVFGGANLIKNLFPATKNIAFVFSYNNFGISYSIMISTFITIMGIGYFLSKHGN
jgi:hypothetical protein